MAKEHAFSNKTQDVVAQCKVVVYPWKNELANPSLSDQELASATRLDISSQITGVTFSKTKNSASGSFTIRLTNSPGIGTQDWKDLIKRGVWCLIYMSNEGDLNLNPVVGKPLSKNKHQEAKKIRCIGYIKRAGVEDTTQDSGAIDREFQISGLDFGVVYEETTIWHNLFKFDKMLLDNIKTTKLNVNSNVRIEKAIDLIHDLFYYPANIPGAQVNDDKSLLSIGLQWLLPKEMLLDLGFDRGALNKGTYWGSLPNIKRFSPTLCGIAVDNPTDFLSGNAWEQLQELSIPQFHELFTETDDNGLPGLTFRPIPWGINQSKYPQLASYVKLYKDLKPVINVPALDLIDDDLAEDDSCRYNSFLATVSTSLINIEDNISFLDGSGFPKNNKASIRRHGFRPMHVTVDSIVKNEELSNGLANREILIEFNEYLYDIWNNAVFSENGTIIKIGTNDVKIGKVMKFNSDVPYLNSKRYYIEGYTDNYSMNEEKGVMEWTQDVILTRGFEEEDLKNKTGFSKRNAEFTAPGEFTKARE